MEKGFFVSGPFWVSFAALALVIRALPESISRRSRSIVVCVYSFAFLASFTTAPWTRLALLVAALAALFLVAVRSFTGGSDSGRSPSRLWLILGGVAFLWALGKVGASFELSRWSHLFFLGASFLLVKLWSFGKDLYDRRIAQPELGTFLAYCLFFPCFISGPMHSYGEFETALGRRVPIDARRFVETVFRLLHGLVKVLILAPLLRPYSLDALSSGGLSGSDPISLLTASIAYSLVIYLDFSGYSDIAISAGSFLGVAVPENFRLPYLARNLRDFWQRWHITFTRFLTQYIFVPFTRYLTRRRATLSNGAVATLGYLLTFGFCGFWHGSTVNFLLWGLYHGAGLAAYDWLRSRSGPRPIPGTSSPSGWSFGRAFGTAATFGFVSIGWTLFVLPVGFWGR